MTQEIAAGINSRGTYHLHGKAGNLGWKIKRCVPFRVGSFRFEATQFFYLFVSVKMIWIYFKVARSPTTSNFYRFHFM